MPANPPDRVELERLLSEIGDREDGVGNCERMRRLEGLLLGNEELQDYYIQIIALQIVLGHEFGMVGHELQPLEPTRTPPAQSSRNSCNRLAERLDRDIASTFWRRWHPAQLIGTVAAMATAIVLAMNYWGGSPPFAPVSVSPEHPVVVADVMTGSAEGDSPERALPSTPKYLGVLAQASGAVWNDDSLPTDVGGRIPAERLKLLEGVVQVELFNGVVLILEAPVDFELVSLLEAICHQGYVRATVPAVAVGFTMVTPTHRIIDLGTEFSVRVHPSGGAEYRVLQGKVELRGRTSTPDEPVATHLLSGEAMVSRPDGRLARLESRISDAVDGKSLSEMSTRSRRKRYESWLLFSQKLRRDPSVLLYYDFENSATWERSLRNASPYDFTGLDGAIVGCQWTDGRWPGKAALEFKRIEDRVRLDVPGEYQSLTLSTWVRVEGFHRWLSSLMLTDEHDLGEVHWQITDDGALRLGVKVEPSWSHDFDSPPVLTPDVLGRWVHLACVYDGAAGKVTHYWDGKAVSREDVLIPTPLRIGPAEIGNWVPIRGLPFDDNWHNRSLNGRIDEFVIYKRPLTADEISKIYQIGSP